MPKAVLALLLIASGMIQQMPPPFPRDNAKQIIDNERVTVWDALWPLGKTTFQHENKLDMVTVELADSTIRVTTVAGKTQSLSLKTGQVTFVPKGVVQMEEGISDTIRHAIAIDLKDAVAPPLENKSGFPDAFPRKGAKKLLDNKRVTVWDYTWTPGQPTPMHYHTRDVVTIYMATGEIRSTTNSNVATVNVISPGLTKFNPRDRTHSEELIKGAGRAIIVELK